MVADLSGSKGLSLRKLRQDLDARRERYGHQDGDGVVWKGVLAGAAAGLVGTVVMTKFQELSKRLTERLQGREDEKGAKPSEEEESHDATVRTAVKVSEKVFHHELTEEEKKLAGPAVHYAFGTTMGALYGGLAEVEPATTKCAGLAFGAALWLAADEVGVPAAGLSKKPTEYPVSLHASELGAHLVYGLTTDLVRRLVRRALA